MKPMENEDTYTLPEPEHIIIECSSVEEACNKAAAHWGIEPEDIEYTVLSEDKKLFGLLGNKLKVEVYPFAPVSYIKSCHFVNEVLDKMELDLIPELVEDGTVNLVGEDAGVVIGRYGETLRALEYITNLVCHDDFRVRRVRFDCGGYRAKRERALTRLAASVAKEAVRKGAAVSLEPMSSWERRIIHIALRDSEYVETKSIGEEPSRRVLVTPKGGARPAPRRRRPH